MKIRHAFRLPFVGVLATLVLAAASPAKALNITPKLIAFKQLSTTSFEVLTTWNIAEAVPAGYVVFTHFTSPTPTDNGDIVAQPDSGLPPPATWKVGGILTSTLIVATLPAKLADGTYKYRVGMFSPNAGDRLTLQGKDDDGDQRFTLGTIVVSGGGTVLSCAEVPTLTPLQEGIVDAWPTLVNFQQTGSKAFQFQVSYDVKSGLPAGYVTFVHITVPNPDPAHDPLLPTGPGDDMATDKWTVGTKHLTPLVQVTLPDGTADGTYNIRVGLWAPPPDGNGSRLKLVGKDDGGLRYVIGTIVVSGSGSRIALKP
jgi:hypothetical protein